MQSYWMTTFSVAGSAVRAAAGAAAGGARAGAAAAMARPLASAAPMARPAAKPAPALATLETWRAAGPMAVGILWQYGRRNLAGSPSPTWRRRLPPALESPSCTRLAPPSRSVGCRSELLRVWGLRRGHDRELLVHQVVPRLRGCGRAAAGRPRGVGRPARTGSD